jgi:uncharacterized membrane protein YdjX (TVP38/TMEM64 family)
VSSSRRFWLGAIIAAVAIAAWWAGRDLAPRLPGVVARIQRLGPAAPIAFVVIYACAVVALFPASVLTIAAGAVFGLLQGAALAFGGAVAGSTAAFLLARYAFHDAVARRLASMPRFDAVERAVSAEGRRIVFFLRLSPLVPFNLLNYALGLTTVSLADYVIASVGMIPATLVYAYGGKVAGEALALTGQAQVPKNASYYGLLLGGLAATVAATAAITRAARRALSDV